MDGTGTPCGPGGGRLPRGGAPGGAGRRAAARAARWGGPAGGRGKGCSVLMAIFELDGGQGTLVQPMRPRADAFEADSAALVAEHVSDLLGEQVLTVHEGARGGPHVRALRHAGGAARLSRADLARMYRGGPEAFEAELAVFRDRAPVLRSQGPVP